MNNKIDKILSNYLKDKYSYNDYLKVKDWVNQIEENKELKEQLFAQWNELTNVKESKDDSLHHIFEKIQYKILLEEKTKFRYIRRYYRQAAAILLIPVLAISLYLFTKTFNQEQFIAQGYAEINAPEGARVEFLLPDSTRGWLNSSSKLKYPTVFRGQRSVELNGEAWFDVKHINESGFVVSVPDMDVKVLGTKFNVSAYPKDVFTNVILEEGKVEIDGKASAFQQILSPNEKITFNRKSRSLNLAQVDARRFSAWKEGYLIIDNEPFKQVVGRIERWYNIDIEIQDDVLKEYRFKATFKDEPLEEVLRLLAKTTPIIYTIEIRSEDSEGVFKKKKVTMKLKE